MSSDIDNVVPAGRHWNVRWRPQHAAGDAGALYSGGIVQAFIVSSLNDAAWQVCSVLFCQLADAGMRDDGWFQA
jgi:hypothetical protein